MLNTLSLKKSICGILLMLFALALPASFALPAGAEEPMLAAGNIHSLLLRGDGTVVASGYNHWGQLGDGTFADKNSPVQVSGLTEVMTITAGYNYSLALKNNGTVWTWGYNWNGQLGDGTDGASSIVDHRNSPVQVIGLTGATAHYTTETLPCKQRV